MIRISDITREVGYPLAFVIMVGSVWTLAWSNALADQVERDNQRASSSALAAPAATPDTPAETPDTRAISAVDTR